MDTITALTTTPLPTLLVIGGFIFLFLGIATIKRPIVIDISPENRKAAFILGVLLISAGIFLIIKSAPEGIGIPETPTPTLTTSQPLIFTNTPTIDTNAQIVINTPTLEASKLDQKSIVISEVLGNPCGQDSRNEYIELYNGGENPVDISNLWITDGDEVDLLVTWQSRLPSVNLGVTVKVDTTIIPPRGFAVILAPGYPFVTDGERIMSYEFADGTIILTLAEGQLIGDENSGIEIINRDGIVLYKGSKNKVDEIISSYGSLIFSGNPLSIKDNGLDNIPFFERSDDCWTVKRINLVNDDIPSNWEVVAKSSPGSH